MLIPAQSTPAHAAPGGSAASRDRDIRRILEVARSVSGLDVAWVSRFDDGRQVFTHVDAPSGAGPRAGAAVDLSGSFCIRVLDGRLPGQISDVSREPGARDLPVAHELEIGAYSGVPLVDARGQVRGMLCATHPHAQPDLGERQQRALVLLALVVSALVDEPGNDVEATRRAAVASAVTGAGRHHVLQPIVDVRTGRAVGAEALSRFDDAPYRPDLWFAEADAAGLLPALEMAAAATCLTSLAGREGYLSINLSPSTIIAGGLDTVLAGVDSARIVVEITEHAAVDDYDDLRRALDPHRAAGVRVAIDDAGAGHSSFRHILQLRPDYIKVDLSLVRDIHLDPARQALTASLLTFGRTVGAQVIAEGVETQDELDTLARLGVTLMQGYLLARPTAEPPTAGFPRPSRHVLVDAGNDLSLVLANAVRSGTDLEQMARPLLDAVLGITGLETSYLTVIHGEDVEHRFVRNAGELELPEGITVPWDQTLCSSMQSQRLTWTNDAQRTLADRPLAAAYDVATYVTTPVTALDGTLLGTLCAGSTQPRYISDAAVAQLQLVAHVISTQLSAQTAAR